MKFGYQYTKYTAQIRTVKWNKSQEFGSRSPNIGKKGHSDQMYNDPLKMYNESSNNIVPIFDWFGVIVI